MVLPATTEADEQVLWQEYLGLAQFDKPIDKEQARKLLAVLAALDVTLDDFFADMAAIGRVKRLNDRLRRAGMRIAAG